MNILLAQGIVPRLRIAFLVIMLVLAVSMTIGGVYLARLNKAIHQLTVSSISVFFRTEDLDRSLKTLLQLMDSVGRITDMNALIELEGEVNSELTQVREDIINVSQITISDDVAPNILVLFDHIETTAQDILNAKQIALNHDVALQFYAAQSEAKRVWIKVLLEDLSLDIATYADFYVSGRPSEPYIYQHLTLSNTMTVLALEIDTLFGMESTIAKGGASSDEVAQLQRNLRSKFRKVSVLIGQLPPSASRVSLTEEVLRMRYRLSSESGVYDQLSQFRAKRAVLTNNRVNQRASIEVISQLSHNMTTIARSEIHAARLDLAANSNTIVIALGAAGSLALLTISLTLLVVVERQINRRMAGLTRSVLAIADGDSKHKIDVAGRDELGKIAEALEVFKLNADELQRSNAELEKFAYAAAHDLRSPLRAIQDLAEWTTEDTDTQFSPDGMHNMKILQSRIKRLSQLLSDLLEYSRVGREREDLHGTSISKIVSDFSELLDPNRQYNVTYSGSCDAVVTYTTPLQQILLNLISNSIKHHDKSNGNITVEAFVKSGRIFLSVQDDGQGIEPQYHDRVFGLFQTLKPRDSIEGSGLGLAIIHKLIERYGGTITIDSNPEKKRGTKFTFDLPEESK